MASKKTATKSRSTKKSVNRKKYRTAGTPRKKQVRDNYATTVLLSAVVSIVLAIFIYFNAAGVVSNAIRGMLLGFFAMVTYLIPPIIAALAVYAA